MEYIMEHFAVIGICATVIVFAITLAIIIDTVINRVQRFIFERQEERRREFLKIKNHKPSSKYVYIPIDEGMYEIRKSC